MLLLGNICLVDNMPSYAVLYPINSGLHFAPQGAVAFFFSEFQFEAEGAVSFFFFLVCLAP